MGARQRTGGNRGIFFHQELRTLPDYAAAKNQATKTRTAPALVKKTKQAPHGACLFIYHIVSACLDSNQGPIAYKATALPTELQAVVSYSIPTHATRQLRDCAAHARKGILDSADPWRSRVMESLTGLINTILFLVELLAIFFFAAGCAFVCRTLTDHDFYRSNTRPRDGLVVRRDDKGRTHWQRLTSWW